jgi:hypothetical protein
VGSNSVVGMDVCLLWVLLCCQVEVSTSGWSLVQRSPTECGVSKKCDREALIMKRPWPTRSCCAWNKMCISEQTAIISLHNTNWLVSKTATESVYWGVRVELYTQFRLLHSTKASYSSSSTCCSHLNDKLATSGNLLKSNTLSDIRQHLRSALLCDITQRRVVSSYRSFGTTYWSHLQGSRSLIGILLLGLLDTWRWDR